MSDHIQKTIDDALAKLRQQEETVTSTKRFINQLCGFAGREVMFPDADQNASTGGITKGGFRRNEFYGQPLATCVGEYLEWRKSAGMVKEATLDEIVTALEEGGFDLATVSKDKDGQKRGVAITLAKNSAKFHRLPNGDFGLLVWYPNVKAKKESRNEGNGPTTATSETATTTEETTTTENKTPV